MFRKKMKTTENWIVNEGVLSNGPCLGTIFVSPSVWHLFHSLCFKISPLTNLKLSTRESGYFNSFLTVVWCHSIESKSIVDKAKTKLKYSFLSFFNIHVHCKENSRSILFYSVPPLRDNNFWRDRLMLRSANKDLQ